MFSSIVAAPRGATSARQVVIVAVACLAILWIVQDTGATDLGRIWALTADIDLAAWMAALVATIISFAAIGRYDVLFHRWLETGVSDGRAARSGMASVALAQTLGFGLVTGTLARWRGLPEIKLGSAALLTHYVSLSFMMMLGLVCAVLLPVTPLVEQGLITAFAVGAVMVAGLSVGCSLLRPSWVPIQLPPLALMLRLCVWTVIDVLCAALAFYLLLPAESAVGFAPVFAAFVLALSAGLVSGTPGGLGPFELCLLTLLSDVPHDALLSTVLAFRLVYYVLPALVGMLCLIRPAGPGPVARAPSDAPVSRAETLGLLSQPGHRLTQFGQRPFHIAETSQGLVIMGDPTDALKTSAEDLLDFSENTRKRCLIPAFYKCGRSTAALARRAGWSVLHVSEEAVLDPASFNLDGAARRQLRRKLRHAEKAGIAVRYDKRLPLKDMAAVARDWAARNGGERGFSMGRFDETAIANQTCFLAYRNDQLVAFATFHHTADEWCLDLMRSTHNASDGTMHTLIVEAVRHAARAGAGQLSLAAMPSQHPPWFLKPFGGSAGLRQFKLVFAPDVVPLYMAAPTRAQLLLAGLDILLRIRWPDSMQRPSATAAMQKLQTRFTHSAVVDEATCAHLPIEIETTPPMR